MPETEALPTRPITNRAAAQNTANAVLEAELARKLDLVAALEHKIDNLRPLLTDDIGGGIAQAIADTGDSIATAQQRIKAIRHQLGQVDKRVRPAARNPGRTGRAAPSRRPAKPSTASRRVEIDDCRLQYTMMTREDKEALASRRVGELVDERNRAVAAITACTERINKREAERTAPATAEARRRRLRYLIAQDNRQIFRLNGRIAEIDEDLAATRDALQVMAHRHGRAWARPETAPAAGF